MSVIGEALSAITGMEEAAATARARVDDLVAETDDLRRCLISVIAQRDEARAEVERLRAEAAPMNDHFTSGYRDGYRDAYRRGAEAMREACAQWVDHWVSGHVADKLRDMPIPEEP